MDDMELGMFDDVDLVEPDMFCVDFGSNSDWLSGDVFGTPDEDASAWTQQETDFTCAVVSQKMILEQFGIDVSESQLVYEATANDWLSGTGTSPDDVGALLELHGVGTHTSHGEGIKSLIYELAQGHKVIVGVDSGEIWGQDSVFEDYVNPYGSDHAIVVTGVDLSNPEQPLVRVNDPGEPAGAGKAYPLDQFVDAWNDSGQMFVATDSAPVGLAEHPMFGARFDENTGWYESPEFWNEILNDVELGTAVGLDTLNSGETQDVSIEAATGVAFWEAFKTIEDFSSTEKNDLFLTV